MTLAMTLLSCLWSLLCVGLFVCLLGFVVVVGEVVVREGGKGGMEVVEGGLLFSYSTVIPENGPTATWARQSVRKMLHLVSILTFL